MDRRDPLSFSEGVLRKVVVVALLIGVVVAVQFLAPPDERHDAVALMALGLVVLTAFALGQVANRARLPSITGYLLAGLAFGVPLTFILPDSWTAGYIPWGTLDNALIQTLQPLETVAMGVIGITAGAGLRSGNILPHLRPAAVLGSAQVAAVGLVTLAFFVLVGGPVEAVSLPAMQGQSIAQALGLGLILGVVAVAGSPATTIAVVNGTGASGAFTRIVLGVVAAKELAAVFLFLLASLIVVAGQPGISLLGAGIRTLGGAAVLGAALGIVLALYAKYVRRDLAVVVILLVLLAGYGANTLQLDPLLMYLAAGATATNVFWEQDGWLSKIERASTPAYLLFFVLLGARLELLSIVHIGAFAGAWVLARVLGLRLAAGIAIRIRGQDAALLRHSWLAFVPQAGVAVPLALILGNSLGPRGVTLQALVLSTIAINELLGPVLLRIALLRSDQLTAVLPRHPRATEEEVATVSERAGPAAAPSRARAIEPWSRERSVPDPWGPRAALASTELNELVHELEADLQGLVRDVQSGPLEAFRSEANAYLRQLRMELLRHHRRVSTQMLGDTQAPRLGLLRNERAALAERWGVPVLARAARLRIATWKPETMVEAVDRLVDQVPEFVEAPVEASSFAYADDSPLLRVRRFILRMRRRWARITGGSPPIRRVAVGTLFRFHVAGRLPARLEGIAALLVDAEFHLVDRTRAVFDNVAKSYESLARYEQERASDSDELREVLAGLRRSFEEEISLVAKEVGFVIEDGNVRTACVLGDALRAIKNDLPRMSTLDLDSHLRRFGKVQNDRANGLKSLSEGYNHARTTAAASYSLLALELEMAGLEGKISDAVEKYGTELERTVEGRAHLQLVRIEAGLNDTISKFEQHFSQDLTGAELAAALRSEVKPLERTVGEAARLAVQLRDQLTDERSAAPLLDAVSQEARSLTDRYVVPLAKAARGAWKLPAPIPVAEVPFREVVQTHIDISVSPALLNVARKLATAVQPLVGSLEELDRLVSFNVEVAVAEVDVFQSDRIPPETRELARELVLGAFQRSRNRFVELKKSSEFWATQAHEGVRVAVLGGLDDLRWQLVEGRAGQLGARLRRQAATRLRWLGEARNLPAAIIHARREARQRIYRLLGADRIARLRLAIGLPVPQEEIDLDEHDFQPPSAAEHLPLVYRRLFSAQALEAGDLLLGREEAIVRGRRALGSTQRGKLRTAVLLGLDGVGKGAVANAIGRGLASLELHAIDLKAPPALEEVDRWFQHAGENRLFVISGFQWLVSARPGGLESLRRFVSGVVRDHGRNAWLIRADQLVWAYGSTLAPLADAFPEVIELPPFDVDQLRAAVLARHAMSGYSVVAPRGGENALRSAVRTKLSPLHPFWFHSLHEASGGLIRDALRLWMASVERIDEEAGQVWMGKVPASPAGSVSRLPDNVMLTLHQTARNGWTSAAVHAALFRIDESAAEAHLRHLVHRGLLDTYGRHYRIAVHLRGAVSRALSDRGWTR